jgi:D-alanine-D-alanine ligase
MSIGKALIFHSKLGPNPPPDELDVLDEAKYFNKGLVALGYEVHQFEFENDLDRNTEIINEVRPDFIVNLVETINADGRLIHIAPAMFEHLAVPFTGCPSEAIYVTSNKLLSKKIMQLAGIRTPAFSIDDEELIRRHSGKQFLLKSLWEHASFGMDEHDPVFIDSAETIAERLKEKNAKQQLFFAEEYIEGREFNVSVIAGEKAPLVLPIAEIKFINFPGAKPKIVGYRAKWDETSFEFKNTIRQFVNEHEEPELCERIRLICLLCWQEFDLRGYARVDFRMDKDGNLYVIEINANPCISADSGFVAAATQSGLSQVEIIKSIVNDSMKP